MKSLKYAAAIFLSLAFSVSQAQNEIPQGFSKGKIESADGQVFSGYVKDNIRKDASLIFINESDKKKKHYDGSDLISAQIDNANFICISGDFFKVITNGKIFFLQKCSNASEKSSYNGTEAVFISGTEGKIGDYFIYSGQTLKLINKNSIQSFISNDLSGCAAAIEKAKIVNGDFSKLNEAIEIYNNSSK